MLYKSYMTPEYNLTEEEAKIIKKFRAEGGTWRTVARLAANEWPDKGYASGNQIEGMMLCTEAARVLKENPQTEPWN